ncbi:MAG: D-alanyl-D-alanine carboxypeptidase family protein, partial [Myxococcota bacterium]
MWIFVGVFVYGVLAWRGAAPCHPERSGSDAKDLSTNRNAGRSFALRAQDDKRGAGDDKAEESAEPNTFAVSTAPPFQNVLESKATQWPRAWILLDPAGSAVLAQHKADVPMAPASTTKVMTLYVLAQAMRQGTLAPHTRVPVSPQAVKSVGEGGSRMWLRAGQHVSMRDLALGLTVHSGNDAAFVIAEAVAGGEQAFVKRMNAHAVRLGMTRTQFRNASGLPQAGHVSTARDLARLTQAFLADFPEEYKIFKEKCFTFAGRKECTKNFLLWQDASADGVKTGLSIEAGYCLIASATRQGTRLISVVLGSRGEQDRVDQSK